MVILLPVAVLLGFLLFCALMTVGEPLNPTRPLMSYDQAREHARNLQKLIACKTVSHKEHYDDTEFAKLRAVMEACFPLVHQKCSRMTFGDDCWVYSLSGLDEDRNILLMAHHDVVEAEGEWQHPPFEGTVADGKLWGRGTVDTKTSLYGIFAALEELLSEGVMPACNVWIASSHNEEVAGDGIPLAVAYFREQGITFDLVLDEGGAIIDAPVGGMTCAKCAMVAIHEKGKHALVLTASDEMGHAGLTSGKKATPTERMAEFIAAFRKEGVFIRRMTPELTGMFRAMAPYMTFPLRVVFSNLWFFKPMLIKRLPKMSPQAAGLWVQPVFLTMWSPRKVESGALPGLCCAVSTVQTFRKTWQASGLWQQTTASRWRMQGTVNIILLQTPHCLLLRRYPAASGRFSPMCR